VDDVEVEVVKAPVCELLPADGLHFVSFVEGVPELGDDEQIFSLYETILDCSSNAFASFFLVAVICGTC
jgi:hypothetical protein